MKRTASKGIFTVKSGQGSAHAETHRTNASQAGAGSGRMGPAERRKLAGGAAPKKPLRSPRPYIYSILVILALLGGYRALQLNWPARAAAAVSQAILDGTTLFGLRADQIVISGTEFLDEEALRDSLGLKLGMAIFAVNLDDVQQELSTDSWIKSATVMRRLPDRLVIAIEERRPIARWQLDGKVSVIDEEGYKLAADHRNFRGLPLVVGAGANTSAKGLISALEYAPQTAQKIYAAQRLGQRRWDLLLVNDLTVHLPESGLEDALKRAEALLIEKDAYHKDIRSVDMRNSSALVLGTRSEFVTARRAQFEQ